MYYFQIYRNMFGDNVYCELINSKTDVMLNYNSSGHSRYNSYNLLDNAIELTKDEYDWFKANFSWFAPWVMDD